jgi:hypothetical protein
MTGSGYNFTNGIGKGGDKGNEMIIKRKALKK